MEITKSTYIDALQRMKIVTSTTRNNCVDRLIFTVKDLEKYLDHRGKITIRGFSVRSINELQNVWDKACEPKTAVPSNKPRRLVRILSQEEKNTISELEDLFESTYLGGVTSEKKKDAYISIENVSTKDNINELLKPTTYAKKHVEDLDSFLETFNLYLDFVVNKRQKPKIRANGDEYLLANWYHHILTNRKSLENEYGGLIESLKNCADTYAPEDYI